MLDLGNYAVTYRVAGFLAEVTHLLSVRSDLRKATLDALHAAGVEIVSPTFMNQRQLAEDERVIPQRAVRREPKSEEARRAEDIAFDKAEQAGRLDLMRQMHARLEKVDDRIDEPTERAGSQRLASPERS